MGSRSARRCQRRGLGRAALVCQRGRPQCGLRGRGRRGRAGPEQPREPGPQCPARGGCGRVGNQAPADHGALGRSSAVGGGCGVAVRRPLQPWRSRHVRQPGGRGEARCDPRAAPPRARGKLGPDHLDPGSRDGNRRGQRPLRDVGQATELGRVGWGKESLPMPERGRDTGQEGRPGSLASLHGFQKCGGPGGDPHNWRR
mmetsp:Transcript_1596/g.3304  ORF Transcript_1596/g.3304 Transcript_1596/m.3304 type:complete len:200 (+) Transcript_1596:253-852(+)